MERTERFWPAGPQLIYDERCFPPSTDSFLLGAFPLLHRGERVCDLGAGTGLLGLLLLSREATLHLTGVECDPHACALASRTAALNGLDIATLQADLRECWSLPGGAFDLAVSNPPYFAVGRGAAAEAERGAARSEVSASLEDVCLAASHVLRYGGRFALVYRPERLCELFACCRACRLEPKRLRFVQHDAAHAPSLALVECKKGGHVGLTAETPLLLYDREGRETEDVRRAYFRDKE